MPKKTFALATSVTRLGDFWNFLVTNFIKKIAQMFGDFLGELWKQLLFKTNWWAYFLGNFWTNLSEFLFQSLVRLLATANHAGR